MGISVNFYSCLCRQSYHVDGCKRRNSVHIFLSYFLLFNLFVPGVSAQKPGEWPAFHGSDRSNKSAETGLMRSWPANGPGLIWSVSGIGEGFSTVSIGGGLLYTSGTIAGQAFVFCYTPDGKLLWKKPNGNAWSTELSYASSYTGARSTPTYDNGIVYQLGEMGRLAAFDAYSGTEIWHRNLREDFDAEMPEYGYSESVLIDGRYLYTHPSGRGGFLVCLNKHNGELVWSTTGIPGTEGYSSLVIDETGGYRQIIGSTSTCYYGVDSKIGRILWRVDCVNQRELNLTDAIVYKDYVFISSGYGKGSMLIKLRSEGKEIKPETVWKSDLMDNHHGGVILYNGYMYGSGSNSRGWFCLDFMTGKQMWKTEGKGSVTFADGMLYMLNETGTVKLVRATPDKFEVSGEFRVPPGGEGLFWAHPVVCGGRLYIRHSDKLYAYSIAGK